jgi:FdrA protein
VEVLPTLDAAAIAAVAATGLETAALPEPEPPAPGGGLVRGLFSGGTLCSEAAAILAERLGRVTTNAPAGSVVPLAPGGPIEGHVVLDLGEEEYTRGRPHPMIDPLARAELIAEQGAAPGVSVLLIDVVLGYGGHADPAGALRDPLGDALTANPGLHVVAHVLGTEADPQPRSFQEAALAALGRVTLCESNAIAARHAAALVGDGA